MSMDAPNTVAGLQRKRAEIAGQIEHIQIGLRALVADLEAIDGALRVFDPDMRLPVIRNKRVPIAHPSHHHDTQRVALDMLRKTTGPVTSRAIAYAVMGARGLDVKDKSLEKMMVARVAACMRRLHARGLVRSRLMAGRFMHWEIA